MRDALIKILEPSIEAMDFDLIDVEFARGRRAGTLRIFIDTADAAARVTVEDCARVSYALSDLLDGDDLIKGPYTLEVSSPGFDRVLRKTAHFERFVGARVAVELKNPLAGRRRFAGTLRAVADGSISMSVDGKEYVLPLDGIHKARLKPD